MVAAPRLGGIQAADPGANVSDMAQDESGSSSEASGLDHGPQPIGALMRERGLESKDLVAASGVQLTHKMVARAVRGRQLTPNAVRKVVLAFNAAAEETFGPDALFTYVTPRGRIVRP